MQHPLPNSPHETCPAPQGSILGSIAGCLAGMAACTLAFWLAYLCQPEFPFLLQLFAGLVIGWFYRLLHGRRSKRVAYGMVGICAVLTCVLWAAVPALLSAGVSPFSLTAAGWAALWHTNRKTFALCASLGLAGFFCTRRTLLTYADWQNAPWHIAFTYAGGALYNHLPERLPAQGPPAAFAVRNRFSGRACILVEGNTVRWKRPLRKDCVFSARDIAGVALGPSSGSNVIYGQNRQPLARFAASMEHADLLFLWLLQRALPFDTVPAGWHLPNAGQGAAAPAEAPAPPQQFTLRLKRSTRVGFAVIGLFLLVLALLLLLLFGLFPAQTTADRWAATLAELAAFAAGVLCLRLGAVCQVRIDGEQVRAVSRTGRAKEFSVRDVSSVSRSTGWIVLYDKAGEPLAKLDPYLEHLDQLKGYFAFYGINMQL